MRNREEHCGNNNRRMKIYVGMGLFIFGGLFYPLSIEYGFARGNWLITIIGIVIGASLITISTVKFLDNEGAKCQQQ